MYKVNCVLEGVAPLMFNKPLPEAIENSDTGKTGGKKTIEIKVSEALRKIHLSPNGFLCIPAWNIKVCMMDGARMAGLTEKRRSLAQYIKGTVFVNGVPEFEPKRKECDGVDERWGRIPPGPKGAMVNLRRPILREGWKLPLSLTIVDDNRTPDRILEALEAGGVYAGLGAFRPEFGRFLVKDFAVLK